MPKKTIINKGVLEDYILSLCKELNPKYTRVDKKFIDKIEKNLYLIIKEHVLFCNQDGKTLK
jgi:hypothetical protein